MVTTRAPSDAIELLVVDTNTRVVHRPNAAVRVSSDAEHDHRLMSDNGRSQTYTVRWLADMVPLAANAQRERMLATGRFIGRYPLDHD